MSIKGKPKTPWQMERHLLGKIRDLHSRGIKCYLCNGEFGLGLDIPSKDHVLPKSDLLYNPINIRGEKRRKNLEWAHLRCNMEKGSLPLLQYKMNKNDLKSSEKTMNLYNVKPTSTKFYWIESNYDIFIGPFKTQEEAIDEAKKWNSGNPQCCPNHDTIVLVYSREHSEHGWVWDCVYPKINLTSCR